MPGKRQNPNIGISEAREDINKSSSRLGLKNTWPLAKIENVKNAEQFAIEIVRHFIVIW